MENADPDPMEHDTDLDPDPQRNVYSSETLANNKCERIFSLD